MPRSSCEKLVSVYLPWQIVRHDQPFDRIPISEARRLESDGLAKSCNRGKAIHLLKYQWQWALRGASCKMNARFMDRVAAGETFACNVLKEWAPKFKVIYASVND